MPGFRQVGVYQGPVKHNLHDVYYVAFQCDDYHLIKTVKESSPSSVSDKLGSDLVVPGPRHVARSRAAKPLASFGWVKG